jgi:hypothetical protein
MSVTVFSFVLSFIIFFRLVVGVLEETCLVFFYFLIFEMFRIGSRPEHFSAKNPALIPPSVNLSQNSSIGLTNLIASSDPSIAKHALTRAIAKYSDPSKNTGDMVLKYLDIALSILVTIDYVSKNTV